MMSKNKTNIWVFSQDESYPERGSLVRHYFLGQHYDKENIDLTIISGNNSHFLTDPPKVKSIFLEEIKNNIKFLWVNLPKYQNTSGFKRSFSWLLFFMLSFFVPLKLKNKPDIIIVSSFPFFPIIFAFIYRLFHRNVKVVLEIRDIYPLMLTEIAGLSNKNPVVIVLKFIEKLAYKFSDHIVSVLSNAYEHIKETVNKPAPFTWISNGISEMVMERSNLQPAEEIPEGFNICYAGSLGHSYALKELVEAGVSLENEGVNIIILGKGPAKEDLERLAANAGNIYFLGKVPKLEVQRYLKSCDILYLGWKKSILWKYGIASNKLFDYMYSGNVIIAACNFTNEIISAASCGYTVETENIEALVDKIRYVKNLSNEERDRIGQQGKDYLLQNLTYKNLAQQYLSLFKQLR